ncbi:hypothetical protein BDV10DRAFT_187903 [Aspergillus recurvatus]
MTIRSQQDIDALAQNCTSLKWDLSIDSQFSGPFVLPNIEDVRYDIGHEYGHPVQITSFEMPDLETAGGIDFSPLPVLESWSVPKLSSTDYILLDIPSYLESLRFPALKEAGNIRIAGNLTDITLDALEAASTGIEITNSKQVLRYPARTRMNISLPVLESARKVNFNGNFSSLSLPQLSTLGVTDEPPDSITPSYINIWGDPISLDLPKLSSVASSLLIRGSITSFVLTDPRP